MKWIGCVLVVALCFGATPAQAADAAAARASFERGQTLFAQKRYAEASREFEAGYALDARTPFLFNIGECARLGGDPDRARDSYERYLRDDAGGKLAPLARKRLAELPAKAAPPALPRAALSPAAMQTVAPEWASAAAPPPAVAPPPAPAPSVEAHVAYQPPPPPPAPAAPFYKRWPFWAAMGALVAGGVAAGVMISSSSPSCGAGCVDLR